MTYKILLSFLGLVALSTMASGQMTTLSAANANAFMDKVMHNMGPQVVLLGLDPFHVPDLHLSFNYTFLWTDHVGILNVSEPYLIGLSLLERNGDCKISYDFKIMDVTVNVVMRELTMDGAYSAHILGMEPSGNLFCQLTDQTVSVSLKIDLVDSIVTLEHFETENDKELILKIDGLTLLGDALATVVIAVLKATLKDTIVSLISDNIGKTLAEFVSGIHFLPPIPDATTVAPLFF